jgi:uncharacterized protein (DUF1697 family)
MSTFISMLRAINVGGTKTMRMVTLRGIYEELGFTHVRSYVQSGNVVFERPEQNQSNLAKQIEAHIERTCGYPVQVFIRQADELQRILAGNPFLNDRNEDPSKLHVTFLYRIPSEPWWSEMAPPRDTTDEFVRADKAIYLFCPNGYGKTKLSNSFFERKLGMPVTTRNWNTVNVLYKMAMEGDIGGA